MINRAVLRAYRTMQERNWDTIYWAIDLHGTCFPSTYSQGGYQFINEQCRKTLQLLSSLPETKIILWSGCYPDEQQSIINFFEDNDIRVFAFNENPAEKNTKSGCFDQKFYFSIVVDDKAGFDPEQDWESIYQVVTGVIYDQTTDSYVTHA